MSSLFEHCVKIQYIQIINIQIPTNKTNKLPHFLYLINKTKFNIINIFSISNVYINHFKVFRLNLLSCCAVSKISAVKKRYCIYGNTNIIQIIKLNIYFDTIAISSLSKPFTYHTIPNLPL